MTEEMNTPPQAPAPKCASLRRTAAIVALVAAIPVTFFLGTLWRGAGDSEASHVGEEQAPRLLGYACAMNDWPLQPGPGNCPKCGMKMEPVFDMSGQGGGASARIFVMSPEAKALARIQTTPAQRRWVDHEVPMVGLVDYDETRRAYVTAYVGGRLDRLFVDFTGTSVRKGDHLVELYSAELLSAQKAVIQGFNRYASHEEKVDSIAKETALKDLSASRDRLRLWGLTPGQIEEIEKRGTAEDRVTIQSPMSGVVIEKLLQQGDYVKTGERIYSIADLSSLWVKLKAYESDLQWLRYGQEVEFTAEAFPGEKFNGRVAFIDPTLDTMTRTVGVRVNVPNPEGRLKPGMYVRGLVRSCLTPSGKVIEPNLAGKSICPMHPSVLKDEPGTCDICGMDLVPTSEMGYVATSPEQPPLVIPATAPLLTGKRAVVYVAIADSDPPAFEGREVTLGPRAGDDYIVIEGLDEGDLVVSRGAFRIDSALQIIAKRSMMSPALKETVSADDEKETTPTKRYDVPEAFLEQLAAVYDSYFALSAALSGDSLEKAQAANKELQGILKEIDVAQTGDEAASTTLQSLVVDLQTAAVEGRLSESIAEARAAFEKASKAALGIHQLFGHAGDVVFYKAFCPMAFDNKGANWLQPHPDVRNPYFGEAMYVCGSTEPTLKAGDK